MATSVLKPIQFLIISIKSKKTEFGYMYYSTETLLR